MRRLITREEWSTEKGGEKMATRSQIPLRLAWGLSIHKSQGMTIDSELMVWGGGDGRKCNIASELISSLLLLLH